MAFDFEYPFRLIHDVSPRAQREIQRDFQKVAEIFKSINSPFVVVAIDGTGDFTSIMDAINSGAERVYVKHGQYSDVSRGAIDIGTRTLMLEGSSELPYISGTPQLQWSFDGFTDIGANIEIRNMDISTSTQCLFRGTGGGVSAILVEDANLPALFTNNYSVGTLMVNRCVLAGIAQQNVTIGHAIIANSTIGELNTNSATMTVDNVLCYNNLFTPSVNVTIACAAGGGGSDHGQVIFDGNMWAASTAVTISYSALARSQSSPYVWSNNRSLPATSIITWNLTVGDSSTNNEYASCLFTDNSTPFWIINVTGVASPESAPVRITGVYQRVTGTQLGDLIGDIQLVGYFAGVGVALVGCVGAQLRIHTHPRSSTSTGLTLDSGCTGCNILTVNGDTTPFTNTGSNNIINGVSGGAGLPVSTKDFTHPFLEQPPSDAVKLRHITIAATKPTNAQVLAFDSASGTLKYGAVIDPSAVHSGDSAGPWLAGTYPSPKSGPDFTQLFVTEKREQYVDRIRRLPITATKPLDTQMLAFDVASGTLKWVTPSGASGGVQTGDFTHPFLYPQSDGNARRISHISIDPASLPPANKNVLGYNSSTKMLTWRAPVDASAVHTGDSAGPWFAGAYPSPQFGPDLSESFLVPPSQEPRLRHLLGLQLPVAAPTIAQVLAVDNTFTKRWVWITPATQGASPGPYMAGTLAALQTGPDFTMDFLISL